MIRTAVGALLVAGLLTACGTQAPPSDSTPTRTTSSTAVPRDHVLKLDVTGTAVLDLTFTLDGKSNAETGVKLPWHKTVKVPYGTGRHEWSLVMHDSGGTVFATGLVDGKLLTQTSGEGSPGSDNSSNLNGSFTD